MVPGFGSDRDKPSFNPAVLIPISFAVAGGLAFLTGIYQFLFFVRGDVSMVVALLNLLFLAGPGAVLLYTGVWLPRSEIPAEYYSRILLWVSGGIIFMFGFIILRDLHPGVSAEWSVGTQAIALMIGTIAGLLIGIEETTVRVRTTLLEERTQRLSEQEERLERQNEKLEEFANVVSHDLRNPLSVADARLELARDEGDSEHLAAIGRSLDRMKELIDDLLTLARERNADVEFAPIRLAAASDRCWSNVETADATLEVADESVIQADEQRLKQLLENLFRNAIEHGGCEVTVTVGELSDGFYIEDTGDGIADGDRSDIFEPGFSTSTKGTGFGLGIVSEIVEAHGWEIKVTAGSEGGARFEITGVAFDAR